MTKKELLKHLESFDDDALIVIDGLDGQGLDDLAIPCLLIVETNVHPKEYEIGVHRRADTSGDPHVYAIHFSRELYDEEEV